MAAAFAPNSLAQVDLLGHWDAATLPPGFTFEIWVDESAPAGGSGITPNDPLNSITDALLLYVHPLAAHPVNNGGTPAGVWMTVNVMPGTYAAGETWPLELPLYGVSLETWMDETTAPGARAVLQPGGADAIHVAWPGGPPEDVTPSVIQGLQIEGGNRGILVDPDLLGSGPAAEPVSVEIRDNVITGCAIGIELETPEHWASLYVVEGNELGEDRSGGQKKFPVPDGATALLEYCAVNAAASTLYRSNRAQLYSTILEVTSDAAPIMGNNPCVPRIFSNFFQLGETIVSTDDCDTFLINNTLAFAVNFGGMPIPETLTVTGGALEHHNNILWSPDDPGFPYPTSTPVDETIPAGTVATSNLVFDTTPGTPPGFVSGDALPIPFAGIMDLHLTAASVNAIGLGTNASTIDTANDTVRSWQFDTVPVGTMTVRTDVNLDVDYDSRIHNSGIANGAEALTTVDIGGDEFKVDLGDGRRAGRIEMTPRDMMDMPDTQNALGNVIPEEAPEQGSILRTWTVELFVDGPPNGVFIMFAGFGFNESILDVQTPGPTITTQNDHVYQNLFLDVLALGSLAVDPDPAITLNLGNGAFDAAGEGSFPVTFYFPDTTFREAETHFQMVFFDPATNRWGLSNRLKVELDDRADAPMP